jgi:hypothetical protein
MVDFHNTCYYHGLMKPDLRISVKDFRRDKNLKWLTLAQGRQAGFPQPANRLLAPVQDFCEVVAMRLMTASQTVLPVNRNCASVCKQTAAGVAKWQTHRT